MKCSLLFDTQWVATFSCSDSLKQHKKYSQMQEASQRDSQSYCPSFQTICTKRQAGSAEAQGQCSLWWSCLSVTCKGSRSSFRALQELIWLMDALQLWGCRTRFPFFFISSHTAAHNRLGMDRKEMSSDCYQQLFCSCAISVFLSHLALWPRTKAHSLVQPLPLRSQLDQLSW